jgi:predicted ATP-dependent serine protease
MTTNPTISEPDTPAGSAMPTAIALPPPRSCTVIRGLDAILLGGLVRNRLYLVDGNPGAG